MTIENDEIIDPELTAAIDRMNVDGRDPRDIAHALVAAGLYHLAG